METQPKSEFFKSAGEFIRFAAIVIAIVFVVRTYIAQPFIVSGTSMVPTFANKDYLIIDEISYRFNGPQRGDVIVFRPPYDKTVFLIKRIVGIPGDTIHVKNGVVTLSNTTHPDGIVLTEDYITADPLSTESTTVVTEGNYFVMGDNRPASYDSRRWGLLPEKNIIGRAFLRLFPVSAFDVFPGAHEINS